MTTTARRHKNPYVGPQSFRRGDALYGRDQEVGDLLDLLIAERVVLLHSPSGAGKTSLIQARLLTLLEDEGFEVLPIIRLTHEVPDALVDRDPPVNRYVLSALLSLEEGLPSQLQRPLAQLAGISLAQYLAEWPDLDDRPGNEVLIFDQFEEVITADPVDHEAKSVFFADLGATLRDRSLWSLFSMREDFVAELDPYARYIPTRLSTRFRLDLLNVDQALEAVTQPARDAGVEFEEEAAVKLVDDLRRVRTQRGSRVVEELGRHVEPVQLQVSCRQIWDSIGDSGRIGLEDIESMGDVNEALADYYAASVAAVARETGVSERALRDWFERELVTSQGFRGQVLEGPDSAGEVGGRVLELLTDAHLLRAESRRGAVWYELAHDRLTQPIEEDNARWREEHLSDIERRASEWDRQGRPDLLLVVGADLEQGQRWAAQPDAAPTRVERDYLAASAKAQQQRDDLVRAAVRTRRWLRLAIGLLVLALVTAAWAIVSARDAHQESSNARQQASAAQRSTLVADGIGEITSNNQLSLLLTLRALASQDPGRAPSSWEAGNALQRALNNSPVAQGLGNTKSADVAAAWSKDGDEAATAEDDGHLRLVNTETGEVLAERRGVGDVKAIAISPSEPGLVVVTLANGSVLGWQTASKAAPAEVAHAGVATDVAFSPNGRLLAVSDAGGTVRILAGRTPVASRKFPRAVNAVAWGADGKLLFAVDSGGALRVWNPVSDKVVRVERHRHHDEATAVAVSPDGTMIATGGSDDRTVISRIGGRSKPVVADTFSGGQRASVSFTSDGAHVLAALASVGGVDVLDPATGERVSTVVSAGQAPTTVHASPRDPARALVTTRDSGAAVWDTELGHGTGFVVALDRDRTGDIVTAAYQNDTVLTWSPDGQHVLARKKISGASVLAAALDPGGRFLVHTSTGHEAAITQLGSYGRDIRLPGDITVVAVSSSGHLVATGGPDAVVRIWNPSDGKLVTVLRDSSSEIRALDFGADDSQLVSVMEDGTAVLWDVDQKRILRTIRSEDDPVTSAEWSGSGDRIAFGRDKGTIQLLGPNLQGKLRKLDWHTDTVNDLAFDPAGKKLASAGMDGYAVLWDARTGNRLRSVKYASWVYRLAFTADGGRLLISLSNTGKPMTVWLGYKELKKQAEARVTRRLSDTECHRYLTEQGACS